MSSLGEILGALVVALLRYLQGRQDLKDSIRKEITIEAFKLGKQAQDFELWARDHPDLSVGLRVRKGARTIRLRPDPPGPDRGAD